MALINCKEPSCTSQVDTTLACTHVSSLFGLRVMLEHQMEDSAPSALFPNNELKQQLDFVNGQLKKFRISGQEEAFAAFRKRKKEQDNVSQPRVSTLYIECAKGHRHYYDVQCEP